MTLLAATVVSLVVLAPLCVRALDSGSGSQAAAPSGLGSPTVRIARAGSQASRSGPAEWFTGSVRVDPLFQPEEPSRASGAFVTFEPSARTSSGSRRGRSTGTEPRSPRA